MNATLLRALIVAVPIMTLFAYAAVARSRHRSTWSTLLLVGGFCLVVVVLAHVAEALHLFPAMGWGEPNSVGHYVDLTSAVGGIALLTLGFALRSRSKPSRSSRGS